MSQRHPRPLHDERIDVEAWSSDPFWFRHQAYPLSYNRFSSRPVWADHLGSFAALGHGPLEIWPFLARVHTTAVVHGEMVVMKFAASLFHAGYLGCTNGPVEPVQSSRRKHHFLRLPSDGTGTHRYALLLLMQ